jgi:CheY-like chemotaxis protein
MGFQFKTAKNGVECLSLLESNYKPDLILLDIMMPIKNGFDTIKDIRNNPNYKSLIVYAVTAHAMLENKEIVERNGFNGIITKPIINEDLEDVLIKIFQSK